jgi:type III secretory pathway component EscR
MTPSVLNTAWPGWSQWLTAAPMLLSLGAFLGVLLLAYIKISVVLAVLRRGLGGIPPASVTAVLALLLSAFAMAPLALRCQEALLKVPASSPDLLPAQVEAGLLPLREFLSTHTPQREQAAVQELELHLRPSSVPGKPIGLSSLLLSFALSELRVAFQIAFVLLLPFLLIDLLCASLLSGLLLPGLSARAVALPFKLLLFVSCDGWQILSRGLLSAYAAAGGGAP